MLNKLFCLQWKGHAQQTCTLWSLTSRIWKIPVTEQCVMSLSFCLWYFNNERWFSLSASHQAVLFIELPVGSHIHTHSYRLDRTDIHPPDTAFTFCHHYGGMAPQHHGYFPALSTFRRETKRGRERESEKLSAAYVRADRGSDRCSGPEEASWNMWLVAAQGPLHDNTYQS